MANAYTRTDMGSAPPRGPRKSRDGARCEPTGLTFLWSDKVSQAEGRTMLMRARSPMERCVE